MQKTKKLITILLLISIIATVGSATVIAAENQEVHPEVQLGELNTVTISVSTTMLAPDVFLMPWEMSDLMALDQSCIASFSEKAYVRRIGPYVDVEFIKVHSSEQGVPLNEDGVTLVTDGELLYIVTAESAITPLAPVPFRRLNIRIHDRDNPLIWIGDMSIGAQVVASGTNVGLHNYANYTFVFNRAERFQLRLTEPVFTRNNPSALATVIARVSHLLDTSNATRHFEVGLQIDRNGLIAGHFGGTRF
ncbi:MAG: hypothetical protein FWC20_02350 [Oscillospiraceae bacterium]|nr:hypothetical protein [Oscillospiraceae bacterium]MCL2278234.1 hypothetical protein [Oscillospiraceae bacterium]